MDTEILSAAILILFMIFIHIEAQQQGKNSLCQQEVRIARRFARKK